MVPLLLFIPSTVEAPVAVVVVDASITDSRYIGLSVIFWRLQESPSLNQHEVLRIILC